MQLDAILEVAIGLIFIWLILSIVTMQIQDIISNLLNRRAKQLEKSMIEMCKSSRMTDEIYKHPLVDAICKHDKKGNLVKPANIPNSVFAAAAMEVFMNAGTPESMTPVASMSLTQVRKGMNDLEKLHPALGRTVHRLMPGLDLEKGTHLTKEQIALYRTNIEDWFENVMARATIEYKSQAVIWAFIIGVIIAFAFNVDTIYISNQLWREPTLRQALIAKATNSAAQSSVPDSISALTIPVGWTNYPTTLSGWLIKILGIVMSGVAVMQGAPFWFDTLKKLLDLRGSISAEKRQET